MREQSQRGDKTQHPVGAGGSTQVQTVHLGSQAGFLLGGQIRAVDLRECPGMSTLEALPARKRGHRRADHQL